MSGYDLGEWSASEPAPGYRVDRHPSDASGSTHRLWHHGRFVTSGERAEMCELSWQTLMHHDNRVSFAKSCASIAPVQTELESLRARCPVSPEDVEAQGVTHVQCWRWLVRMGFSQSPPTRTCGFHHLIGNWGPVLAHGYAHTQWTSKDIAQIVNTTSWRGPAHGILAEMSKL